MNEHIVRKKIAVKAKAAAVWDALTNPVKTKQYFFNCKVFSDWEVGSSIVFKGRMFLILKIELTGTIEKIEPKKLLQYRLRNRGADESSLVFSRVTIELFYENGLTTLSITDDVGEGEGVEKRYRRSVKGWDKVLKGLKKLVEEEASLIHAT